MKTLFSTLFLLFMLLLGCNKTPQIKDFTTKQQLDSLQLKTDRITIINSNAQIPKQIKDNANFEALTKNIDTLNRVSFMGMKSVVISINENIEELKETLPITYRNKSVQSRLNEMYTYSKDVTYRLTLTSKDTLLLNTKVNKLLTAYNHLLTQINETTYKLPDDFKKELNREKEIKKDTIAVEPLF
ncbi:hypothetical protein [Aquimarina agarivorans]|uniref:hypothetical protein n=1 Tax=Aquimarina agarivorans TaxID=980584 RepID=UPI000248E901|nr:hypothetical protein [Aquimarina agarivorans]